MVITLSAQETFQRIKNKLDDNHRFAYIRYGDVEVKLMSGWKGKEQNHKNSPELQKSTIDTFQIQDPNFMIGLPSDYKEAKDDIQEGGGCTAFGYNFRDLIKLRDIIKTYSKRILYYSPIAIYYIFIYYPNLFKDFLNNYIKKQKVLYIGKKKIHINSVCKFFNIKEFVEIPEQNCFYHIKEFYNEILNKSHSCDLILVSAGNGKVGIINKLWNDTKHTILDIGTIPDIIINNWDCRSWIRVMHKKNYVEESLKIING